MVSACSLFDLLAFCAGGDLFVVVPDGIGCWAGVGVFIIPVSVGIFFVSLAFCAGVSSFTVVLDGVRVSVVVGVHAGGGLFIVVLDGIGAMFIVPLALWPVHRCTCWCRHWLSWLVFMVEMIWNIESLLVDTICCAGGWFT